MLLILFKKEKMFVTSLNRKFFPTISKILSNIRNNIKPNILIPLMVS